MGVLLLPKVGIEINQAMKIDGYLLEKDTVINPDENYIISRDKQGNVVSYYKDDIWDFKYYKSNSKSSEKIFFEKIHTKEIRKEAKRLIFIIMAFKKIAVNYNLPKQIAEEIENKRFEISKNWNERWNNANLSVRNSMAAAVVRPIVDKYKEELKDKDLVQAIYKILEDDFNGYDSVLEISNLNKEQTEILTLLNYKKQDKLYIRYAI